MLSTSFLPESHLPGFFSDYTDAVAGKRPFGNALGLIRVERKLEPAEVRAALNRDGGSPVDKTKLSRWEHGTRRPSIRDQERLAGAYGVPFARVLAAVEGVVADSAHTPLSSSRPGADEDQRHAQQEDDLMPWRANPNAVLLAGLAATQLTAVQLIALIDHWGEVKTFASRLGRREGETKAAEGG